MCLSPLPREQLGARHQALQELVRVLPGIKHKVSPGLWNQLNWRSNIV